MSTKLSKLGVVGPEKRKPTIPHSENSKYVLLPENIDKPKAEGGPSQGCECFDEERIRENGNKLTSGCIESIYERSGCRRQGLEYLKKNHRQQYDDLTSLKPTEVGNIAKMSGKMEIVSAFVQANKNTNTKGGFFYSQDGNTEDELRERKNVCYGEN